MEVDMDTVDEDRISNLPSYIIDLILSFLPMKDILRTSALSTKWRYQWTTVPKLVFMENNMNPSMGNSENSSRALANVINHVLLLHTGSIENLQILGLRGISNIDHWVIFVSKKAIKQFALKLQDTSYTLHSSLYNCQSLTTLQLSHCTLRPPLYFTGWKSLRFLHLDNVTPFNGNPFENDDALNNMISACPVLEGLSLINVQEIGNLHINAQNLLYFYIMGFFRNITFGPTVRKLVFLSVEKNMDDEVHGSSYKENSLIEFFINLPDITRLILRDRFMRYLTTVGVVPERLRFPLNELIHLTINFHIGEQRQNLGALCLFKSSPNLRDIVILIQASTGFGEGMSSIWKCSSEGPRIFEKLQSVTIYYATCQRSVDLALVKFMLAESPVLEKMRIYRPAGDVSLLREFVLRFKRASAKAEIIFK